MPTLAEEAQRRGVTEIVHFTHQRALLGIAFTKAVLPRSALRREQLLEYILRENAARRTDGEWFGHVSLSISDINRRFFRRSERWHQDLWWVILAFDLAILDNPEVVFATTNNMYRAVRHGTGLAGFRALFDDPLAHGGSWATHPRSVSHAPVCPQAEVLYKGPLSVDYLRRVYVRDRENYREACSYLSFLRRDIPVEIAPERFVPPPTDPCEHPT